MLKILHNKEVKNIIISISLTFLICFFIFFLIINIGFENLSNTYAKQNISLVGAIVDKDPQLESYVVPIITKGDFGDDYNKGLQIMSKYSYDSNLKVNKNYLIESQYMNIQRSLIVVEVIMLLVIIFIVIKCIKPIYMNLIALGNIADEMVEGNFKSQKLMLEEGEFQVFYNKFNNMGERLESAVNSLKKKKINLKNILNDISHQLKTPLAALITYNDILKNYTENKDEAISKFLELSSEQLDRMEWLVVTLLKFARLESNVVKFNRKKCNFKNTVEQAIRPLLVLSEEKQQKLCIKDLDGIIFNHDNNWLGEAITNIVKNAIEHTQKGGEINIWGEETPLYLKLFVKDNGEGIKKENLKKIFKRFYKGENTLNPKSIGIGLALSKSIIQSHDGVIDVESELGVGTVFEITFLKNVI